jgi:prevent-host-death family protein
MRIAPLADVKAKLGAYLEECETDGPIVITRNGKAVAVLLAPVDDDDLESLILARSPRFQDLLDKSRQSIKTGKGLSRTEFWQTVAERDKKKSKARRAAVSKTTQL